MMKTTRFVVTLALLAVLQAISPTLAQDFGGLPPGEGRYEVFAWCTACHSARIIVQQGLTRDDWDELLVWMVEEQGMQELDSAMRKKILDYLSEQFPPERPNYKVGSDIP
jgi:cytochrome c